MAVVVLVLSFGLRIAGDFYRKVDSDEPQHMHVAWAWTQGMVQYRDVFDNHTPLFHLLTAPLVAMFGERPDIVPLMRLTMLPIAGGVLVMTWLLCRPLFGKSRSEEHTSELQSH